MAHIPTVTLADYDAVVMTHEGLVLVDLWSPGCVPCRALAPIVEDLAQDFAGDLAVRKIDVEAELVLADRLNVRAVPTLVLYRNGVEIDRLTGMHTRSRLTTWIEGHL